MTIDDLQDALDSVGWSISHLGWANRPARDKPPTKYAVTLVPAAGNSRWRVTHGDIRIRALGPSMEAAIEEALAQLGALVLVGRTREDPEGVER